jgi:hypothetical protein
MQTEEPFFQQVSIHLNLGEIVENDLHTPHSLYTLLEYEYPLRFSTIHYFRLLATSSAIVTSAAITNKTKITRNEIHKGDKTHIQLQFIK